MFKLYQIKNSLNQKNSRMLQGGDASTNGDAIWWWDRHTISKNDTDSITIQIDRTNQFRPDLVAYEYYNRTDLEWVILQYNNIVDVKEEFIIGRSIIIPSRMYVQTAILNKSPGV